MCSKIQCDRYCAKFFGTRRCLREWQTTADSGTTTAKKLGALVCNVPTTMHMILCNSRIHTRKKKPTINFYIETNEWLHMQSHWRQASRLLLNIFKLKEPLFFQMFR